MGLIGKELVISIISSMKMSQRFGMEESVEDLIADYAG